MVCPLLSPPVLGPGTGSELMFVRMLSFECMLDALEILSKRLIFGCFKWLLRYKLYNCFYTLEGTIEYPNRFNALYAMQLTPYSRIVVSSFLLKRVTISSRLEIRAYSALLSLSISFNLLSSTTGPVPTNGFNLSSIDSTLFTATKVDSLDLSSGSSDVL